MTLGGATGFEYKMARARGPLVAASRLASRQMAHPKGLMQQGIPVISFGTIPAWGRLQDSNLRPLVPQTSPYFRS